MNVLFDPDEWVTEKEAIDADGHCCYSYKQRRATQKEYRENKYKRLSKLKIELEAQLNNINNELEVLRLFDYE